MTSSILPPRRAFAPCSPMTQVSASTTLDFPDPLGPTTQVIPGSKRRVVAEAKDLKPLSVRLLRCMALQSTGCTSPARTRSGASWSEDVPSSPLDETVEPTTRPIPALHDEGHHARRISSTKQCEEALGAFSCTLGNDEHSTVRAVRRVAAQSEFEGARTGPPSKPDALHRTVHPRGQPDLARRGQLSDRSVGTAQ